MSQAQKQNNAKMESYTEHQAAYLAYALTIDGSAEDNLSKSLASSKVVTQFGPRLDLIQAKEILNSL